MKMIDNDTELSTITIIDFPISGFLINQPIKTIASYETPTLLGRIFNKLRNFLGQKQIYKISESRFEGLKSANTVIVFDSLKNYSEICSIVEQKVNASAHLILYLWNPVSHSNDYENLSDRWTICSFSHEDAKSHGFCFVDTFYNPYLVHEYQNLNNNKDVFFIGTNKGRFKLIRNLQHLFNRNHVTTNFKIVDNFRSLYDYRFCKGLSYSSVCNLICQSRALLEITQRNQNAPTLRTMEALFFKKKLITNNPEIKTIPFYDKNNIFILNEDDIANLKVFIESDFSEIDDSFREYYSFNSWINRILKVINR